MRLITLSTIALCLSLSISASAADPKQIHEGKKDDSADSSPVRPPSPDNKITDKTADVGKVFFGNNKDEFRAMYDKVSFSGKRFYESINAIKPTKGEEEGPTVEQEMPNAQAIATMFDDMTDKDVPNVVSAIWKAYAEVKKAPTSDSQHDEVVKRLWEAAQLKIPANLWPKTPPKEAPEEKDPRLAKFREAFIKARNDRLDFAKDLHDKIQLAAGGNKKAQEELFGSKTDKSDPEANKYAVGAHANNYINKLFAEGNTNAATDMIKALSVNGKMYLNNAKGESVSMQLPTIEPKNYEQLSKIFKDSKMAGSQFVGHEPDKDVKTTAWIWDKGEVKAQGDSKGVGGQQPAATNAAGGAGGAGGDQQNAQLAAEVTAIVATKCKRCHATSVSNGQIIGKANVAGSANTDWGKMLAGLPENEANAIKKFAGAL